MELNDILLQLLTYFCLFLQQVLPGLEDLIAPFDEQLISGLEFIDQDDLVLEKVVIVCNLLIEFGFPLTG